MSNRQERRTHIRSIRDFQDELVPLTVDHLRRAKGFARYEGPVLFREIDDEREELVNVVVTDDGRLERKAKPHYKWMVVNGRGRWVLGHLRWHPEYPIHLSTYKTCSVYDRFKKGMCGLPVEPGFNQCQHHFVDAGRCSPREYRRRQ